MREPPRSTELFYAEKRSLEQSFPNKVEPPFRRFSKLPFTDMASLSLHTCLVLVLHGQYWVGSVLFSMYSTEQALCGPGEFTELSSQSQERTDL